MGPFFRNVAKKITPIFRLLRDRRPPGRHGRDVAAPRHPGRPQRLGHADRHQPQVPEMILSASRDKSLIVWKLTRDETQYGIPQKRLHGHGHFVSDVVLSSDGHFALSGSWDKTLRLWDLSAGKTT